MVSPSILYSSHCQMWSHPSALCCFSGCSSMVTGWWIQLSGSTYSSTPTWSLSLKSRWCPMDLSCQSCRLLAQASHPRKKCGSVTNPAMLWLRPFPRLVPLARGNTFLLSAQRGQEGCYWGQLATASPLQSTMQAAACVEGTQQCWGIEGLLILGLLSLELPFQLTKPIYPKNCQLKIRQVQRERGGREVAGWTRVILPMAGASALCGPAAGAGRLQKLKQRSWAGLLGGGIGLDLSVWR